MIVKNEAQNLLRCLHSVQSVVDEMIIVDTGSSDETIALAHSFNAQVHHFNWNNDFAAARNASLQPATGDWILVLDADEVLHSDSIPTLKQAIQQENCLVVNLVRQEIGAMQSPYSLVSRLFRRHPELRFQRPYHAMIDDSVTVLLQREPDWRIINLPNVAILHYGYEPGMIASRNKYERAETAIANYLTQHPGDPYACSKLGALYVELGQWQNGLPLLQQGLQSTDLTPAILYELHYHLGITYSRLGKLSEAQHHYQLATQQPILPILKLAAFNNLGNLVKEQGQLNAAQSLYETCIQIDATFALGHNNLGLTLKALGQMPQAIAHYQQAIALNPNYAEAYQNLGVALLKLGRVPESLAAFQRAIELHLKTNPSEAQRLRQGLQEMGFQLGH
jgi:tetratricopeptide (TPR) repeat protein